MDPGSSLLWALQSLGVDLLAWLLAWARVLPAMVLIPAFGARLLPAPARVVLGLALAWTLLPLLPIHPQPEQTPFGVQFALELLQGLPVALSTAAMMWAAMMAGGLMDDLRGASQQTSNVFTEASTPFGALLGLFAAVAFLELGGTSHLLEALVPVPQATWTLRAALDLVAAIHIAFALAAPILVAVVVGEVASALIVRAASPAHLLSVMAPLRSLLVLGVLAFSLDGMLRLLGQLVVR